MVLIAKFKSSHSLIFASVLVAFIAGCESKDQEAAVQNAKQAAEVVSKVAVQAWDSARAELSKVDLKATQKSIDDAKEQLDKLKGELGKTPDKLHQAAISAEKEKIAAIEKYKKVSDDLQTKLEEAKKAKDDGEKLLKETQQQINTLQHQVDTAKKTFDSCQEKAQKAWDSIH